MSFLKPLTSVTLKMTCTHMEGAAQTPIIKSFFKQGTQSTTVLRSNNLNTMFFRSSSTSSNPTMADFRRAVELPMFDVMESTDGQWRTMWFCQHCSEGYNNKYEAVMHERVCSEGPRTRVYLARKNKASEQHQRAQEMAWTDKVEKEDLRQHKRLKAKDAAAKKNFERHMVGGAMVTGDEANDGYAEQPNSEQKSVALMSKRRK